MLRVSVEMKKIASPCSNNRTYLKTACYDEKVSITLNIFAQSNSKYYKIFSLINAYLFRQVKLANT
jgi:hypothetical protein